ncbi:hypothetical protein T484DRAFT_1776325 [Baffinella frigidus]|nr:hypothetical protein T484DRAFT_1776325 [Cryptophyta sp. CCMP2293]
MALERWAPRFLPSLLAGLNENGQLGDGTDVNNDDPSRVVEVGTDKEVESVGLGRYHTCATIRNPLEETLTKTLPKKIIKANPGKTKTNMPSPDQTTNTNTIQTNELKCWGLNGHGQLGDSTMTDPCAPLGGNDYGQLGQTASAPRPGPPQDDTYTVDVGQSRCVHTSSALITPFCG